MGQRDLDLFDDGFREAWREKEEEYAMPVKKRVYCEHRDPASGSICGEFLGRRGLGQKRCERCQCYTCGACGTTSDNATSARNHSCNKATTVDDVFAEFQKGATIRNVLAARKRSSQLRGAIT